MSIKQMSLVWQSDLARNLQHVALALAEYSNDKGRCWPAMTSIAAKTGYSLRQTRRIMRELVDLGYVVVVEDATPRRSARYQLHPEVLPVRAMGGSDVPPEMTSVSPQGGNDVPSERTPMSPQGGHDDPRSVIEPSVEPPMNRKKATRRVATLDTTTVDRFTDPTPSTRHADAARPANHLWDAMEATFGYRPVGAEARLWGKLVNQLATMGAHPDDVTVRAQRLLVQWGPDKLTPTSLVKHWQRFGSQLGTIHLTERERAELVARQRLADELDALPDNALEAGR